MTAVLPDAPHLDPLARAALELPDDHRIARIDRDLWIGYGRALDIGERLERILQSGRRMRPDNLLVVGPSNNGKTAIARRFLARHTPPEDPGAERATIPVALVQAPNGPRIPQLLAAILAALGRPPLAWRSTAQLRAEAQRAMADVGLRLLLIDDLHNIRGPRCAPMLVELREIGSCTGVSLGGFATREVADVLRQDEELANRMAPCPLPRWRLDDPDYPRLLATFARHLPLRRPSSLTQPDLAARLLAAADGLIGGVAATLRRAAAEAVRTGHECIDDAMLARPGVLGPPAWAEVAAAGNL